MSTATRRRPARLALVTAAAVAAGALGILPTAPANAAQTGAVEDGSLAWELSTYLNSANMGRPNPHPEVPDYTASLDAVSRITTWDDGAGTVNPDGSAALSFDGTSVNWATTGSAWLKITDPEVNVDATGSGTLSATVSYGSTAGDWSTAVTTAGPTKLTLVDLSVNPADGDATYPAAIANAAYDFSSTASTYTWSNLKGRWSTAFLQFLWGTTYPSPPNSQAGDCPGSVGCWTYGSGVNHTVVSNISRYPALLNVSIDRAVAGTEASLGTATAAGVPLAIAGAGFKKTAPGVYASVRESNAGDPAYAGGSVQADAPTAWVSNDPADMSSDNPLGAAAGVIGDNGSFDVQLPLTPEFIESYDPEKVYSLVTRKGHGQGTIPSNADQVTETPLDLSSLAALAAARELTTVNATVANSVYGTPATAKVVVDAATGTPGGTVTVKEGAAVVGSGTLAGGTVDIALAGLSVGAHALTVEYAGDAASWASNDAVTATVTKGSTTAAITAPASSTFGSAVTVKVAVGNVNGPVTLTGAGAPLNTTLAGGQATFSLPATLAAGSYTLTATYAGDANRAGASATHQLTVAKASTKTAVKVAPKATAKKAGKATVTVTGASAGSKVVVTVKGAGKTVKKTVTLNASGKAVVALKKAPKGGSFKVTAAYAGDANHGASTGKASYKVAKPKKAKKR